MKRFRVEYDVYAQSEEILRNILDDSAVIPLEYRVTEVSGQPDPGWYQDVMFEEDGTVYHFTSEDIISFCDDWSVSEFRNRYRRVNRPTPYTGVLNA